ncbi:MAG: hypothetical protein WAN18_05195, partial [Candidatus Sulfotelmatobacter sp.]
GVGNSLARGFVHGSLLRPEVAWVEVMFAAFCPRCEWKEGRKEGRKGQLYLACLSMFLGRTLSHAAVSTRIAGYKDVSRR